VAGGNCIMKSFIISAVHVILYQTKKNEMGGTCSIDESLEIHTEVFGWKT
jgi:hypothetical protein